MGLIIKLLWFSSTISFSLNSMALEGFSKIENLMFEQNQEIKALESQIESREALTRSANSAFYPSLNAVAGYEQNKTDETVTTEKGNVIFLEGRLNLFRGFKDQSVRNIRDAELQLAKLDLEARKNELRLHLTEILSGIIYLHRLQDILKEEYKVTQSHKQMASKKVSAGLTSHVDNLEFTLRESEIEIEQRQISQQHEEFHQKLIQILGRDLSDSEFDKIVFSPADKLSQYSKDLTIEKTIDFLRAQLVQNQSEFERKEIKSDFMPSVDFSYSAGRLTPSQTNSTNFNESKYAIHLTVPLFSGFDTYHRTRAVNSRIQAAERLKNQSRLNVQTNFNTLKTKLSELTSLYAINEKKLATTQKYFDATISEYRRGIKNSPDLVGATERFFSTKKRNYELIKELETLNSQLQSLAFSPQ